MRHEAGASSARLARELYSVVCAKNVPETVARLRTMKENTLSVQAIHSLHKRCNTGTLRDALKRVEVRAQVAPVS